MQGVTLIGGTWLDIEQTDLLQISSGLLFGKWQLPATRELETGFTDDLAATFADLIDQKSKFTARHSRSVAEKTSRSCDTASRT